MVEVQMEEVQMQEVQMQKNRLIAQYYNSWFEINRLYSQWAGRKGLEDTTLFILYEIAHSQDECTLGSLCSKLFLPKQTVSQILGVLEKEGTVYRQPSIQDRRQKIIRFTEAGIRSAKPLLEELRKWEQTAFGQMSQLQQQSVIEGLRTLADALSSADRNLAQ